MLKHLYGLLGICNHIDLFPSLKNELSRKKLFAERKNLKSSSANKNKRGPLKTQKRLFRSSVLFLDS